MNSVDEFKSALLAGLESEVGPSLEFIAQAEDIDLLRELASFALEAAVAKPHAMAYGPRMMIAGAAAARADQLESNEGSASSDDELLAEFNALQSSIDTEQRALPEALRAFGPLGARLCVGPHRPFLDLEVDSNDDDAVLLWASGAAALAHR